MEPFLSRGFGLAAFLLLHFTLPIAPPPRLARPLLPLLYNRRHLGVAIFFLGLTHATLSIIQYHAGGGTDALVSVLTAHGGYGFFAPVPLCLFCGPGLGGLVPVGGDSHGAWRSRFP